MNKLTKSKLILQVVIATLVTTLATAGIVLATTIGTDVSTAALTASGVSTLTGAITSGAAVTVGTDLTVTSGAKVGAPTGTHFTALDDNTLIVAGQSEFDGIAWFDGSLRASSTLLVTGATNLYASTTIAINGTKALSVTNASGVPIFEVDTTNSRASTTALLIASSTAPTLPAFNASSSAVSIGDGTSIKKLMFGSCWVDLPNTVASSTSVANCTAAGVVPGDIIIITPVSTSSAMVFRSASSTAANTIQVSAYHTGYASGVYTATTDPDAAAWYWMAMR